LTVEQRAQRNRNFLVICIGCIDSASTSGQATTVSVARAQGKPSGELTISNWPLYVDKQTVPDFERASGIKVKYIEDINSYDEFFGKMQPILAQGESGGHSLMVATTGLRRRCTTWATSKARQAGSGARPPQLESQRQGAEHRSPLDLLDPVAGRHDRPDREQKAHA